MTGSLNISLKRGDWLKPINLVPAAYVLIAAAGLQHYILIGSVNFILGVLAMPFVWKTDPAKKGSNRYGWITIAWLVLCFVMPVKTLLYFSIGFAILFFSESFYGKTSPLAVLVIVFASPVFQNLADVFSFPIRLQLTKAAGWLLNCMGSGVEIRGNTIMQGGNEFSVDPACMGLNMIAASILAGIMVVGFYQQKYERRVRMWTILCYLLAIFTLNSLSNLFRIVLLVQFNIQPETISHDLAGLACLLLYVLLPAIDLARMIVKQSAMTNTSKGSSPVLSSPRILRHLALLAGVGFAAFKVLHGDTFQRFNIPAHVDGYGVSEPAPGIVKLDKPGSLIYVKFIRGFYDTEHNPMLCWTGVGYRFSDVVIEKIANQNVFTGVIVNGNDKLYSAWWYDNGDKSTTSQLEWRWDLMRGANHYVLVNVSCPGKKELEMEMQRIIEHKTLVPFFQ